MAWEYPNESLVPLCSGCHQEVHQSTKINVYDDLGNVVPEGFACERCNGSGYLKEYFYHMNGICFGCNGEGVVI